MRCRTGLSIIAGGSLRSPISSSRPTMFRPVTASGLRPIFTTFCYNTRGNPLHVSRANSSTTLQESFAHALHILTSSHNIRLPTPLSMISASNNTNLNSPFSNTKILRPRTPCVCRLIKLWLLLPPSVTTSPAPSVLPKRTQPIILFKRISFDRIWIGQFPADGDAPDGLTGNGSPTGWLAGVDTKYTCDRAWPLVQESGNIPGKATGPLALALSETCPLITFHLLRRLSTVKYKEVAVGRIRLNECKAEMNWLRLSNPQSDQALFKCAEIYYLGDTPTLIARQPRLF